MPIQELIQRTIHRVEEAGGMRYVKYALVLLVVAFLALVYNLRASRNFSTQEAMDNAQLARNLAQGRGYTTLFIRPFSMYLLKERNVEKSGAPPAGKVVDYSGLREAHPDIANAPVYPVVLAGLMKTFTFNFAITKGRPFWNINGRFAHYQPDFVISAFNQVLLLATIAVAALWARRQFDASVGWTAALLLLGSELLWRFSSSGLSTLLLLLIFLGLVWCLTVVEARCREPQSGTAGLWVAAAGAGILLALGGLTRYAFAWLIVPVLIFLVLFAGTRRASVCLVVLAVWAVLMAPWIIRNYELSGAPFGTASYSFLADTEAFPGDHLERSLNPDMHISFSALLAKFFANVRTLFQQGIFSNLGGGWIGGFFLAGLLVRFNNPSLNRLRYFLLLCLVTLAAAQAGGRTYLSDESPEINSENLLVICLPLVFIYGISFFYLLLDQVRFPLPQLRYGVVVLLGALVWLPMFFVLLAPRTNPVAYPPYYPPIIQQVTSWMKENELMMSDIPWAVAWYGSRPCLSLTLAATPDPAEPESDESFVAISDYLKPVHALYLTPRSMDKQYLADWIHASPDSWERLIYASVVKREIPSDFPLHYSPGGFLPAQLFLADWQRW